MMLTNTHPCRYQHAGASRSFYSGKPTELASIQHGGLFTSFSIQQSTAEALKPEKPQAAAPSIYLA